MGDEHSSLGKGLALSLTKNALCRRMLGKLGDSASWYNATLTCNEPIVGRYISVQVTSDRYKKLRLCEVDVG